MRSRVSARGRGTRSRRPWPPLAGGSATSHTLSPSPIPGSSGAACWSATSRLRRSSGASFSGGRSSALTVTRRCHPATEVRSSSSLDAHHTRLSAARACRRPPRIPWIPGVPGDGSSVSQDFLDRASRERDEVRIRLRVVGDDHGRLMKRVAASANPHVLVHVQGRPERLSPRDAETLHAAMTSAAGSPTPTPPKSITATMRPASTSTFGLNRSAWIPHRATHPLRGLDRVVPHGEGRVAVDHATCCLDRVPGSPVQRAERGSPAPRCVGQDFCRS